jgi:hypothetical protein
MSSQTFLGLAMVFSAKYVGLCGVARIFCRSEPAREDGRMFNIFSECEGPIAGKPAPTGFSVATNFVNDTEPCGSWLARDEAVTSDSNAG